MGLHFGDLGLRGCQRLFESTLSTAFRGQWRAILETCRSLFFVKASLLCFFHYLFGELKKLAKMTPKRVCPESLRRVPVSTGAQFSLLQPNPKRAPKWEPKWSVLGAKVVTILLFVRPCRENRPSKSFTFFDTISEHVASCAAARGGLARPEGGYLPGESGGEGQIDSRPPNCSKM